MASSRRLRRIAEATGGHLGRDHLDGVRAMALGLLAEVCLLHEPMDPEDARRILRAHLAALLEGQRTAVAAATTSTSP